MRVRSLLILSLLCLGALAAEPVARVGGSFIEAETLHLVQIAPNLSSESASAVRQQNTRALVSYLESYFTERYLEETGNPITGDKVEEKIDELLMQTYGPSGYTSDKYGKQIQQMAKVAELLTIYERSPEEAEAIYAEKYSETLAASYWEQMKNSYSKAGLEQMREIIEAPLPSESQVRSAYRGQAHAHVLNRKFLDVWGRTDTKYSDWRKERFSKVEILEVNYFEMEQLVAWFGYDELSNEKESAEQVISEVSPAPPVEEVAEVIEEVTASEPAIEEPAEVVVEEAIEEEVEQSSNWWPWFIGILVIVGVLGLVVRRKN